MTVPGNLSSPLLATAAAAAGGGAAGVATRSLRFNAEDSAHLVRTPSSSGNVDKWTWAGWIKRTAFGDHTDFFSAVQNGNNGTVIQFDNNDRLDFENFVGGSDKGRLITEQFFRDPSAWYHITCIYDSGNSTADDRIKLFVNGSQVTTINYRTNPGSGQNSIVNSTNAHYVGADKGFNNHYFNGYLADVYLIDGLAIEPVDNFIELDNNGVYQAKVYSGTYGTNGFHLTFSDATSTTTVAEDSSGNNNDFTANNISVTAGAGNDSLFDVPTNGDTSSESGAGGEVSGNYCVLNPLHVGNTSSNATTLNGNLVWGGTNNNHHVIAGTIAISSGKYYWEATYTNASSNYVGIGMCKADYRVRGIIPGYDEDDGFVIYSSAGRYYYNSTSTSAYGTSWTTGDVIGVRYDEGDVYFYKNGTIMNASPILSLTGSWCPLFHTYDSGQWTVNFGQRPFAHSAPTNHKPLCTSLLPTPAVANGADYFATSLYTGTGSAGQSVSGLNFQPDWVWFKARSEARDHAVFDSVRGVEKRLHPSKDQEEDDSGTGLTAFNSDGYTFGSNNANGKSGVDFVSYAWKSGSSTATNTDGTISAQVRVSQTSGISIATYTGNGTSGATIGHGLGVAPAWWVMKSRSHSGMWVLRHKDVANTHYLQWDTDHAPRNAISDVTGDADATSTVIPVGSADANNSGRTHVAYIFSEVPGFSAIGKYTGNGSTSGTGPFINLGFRPAWIMCKNITAVSNYRIFDSTRDPINYADRRLFVDSTSAESQNSTQRVDILSNGFRILGNGSASTFNINNHEIIYVAFAEHPFAANGGLAR